MDNVLCPKDLERLSRSTSKALARAENSWSQLLLIPRTPAGDPVLIKKYNLIEFL